MSRTFRRFVFAGLAFGSPTWGVFGLYTGMVTSVWTMTVRTRPHSDWLLWTGEHHFLH